MNDVCSSHYLLSFHESRYERWNKECIYLNITTLSWWIKWLRNLNVVAEDLIYKRSVLDSSTKSFRIVAWVSYHIYALLTRCLQGLDCVPAMLIRKGSCRKLFTIGKFSLNSFHSYSPTSGIITVISAVQAMDLFLSLNPFLSTCGTFVTKS